MPRPDLLKLTLESLTNFVIVDQEGKIYYINEMYARLLGRSREEITGKAVTDVIPGTHMMEILETGKPQSGDIMTLYDHNQHRDVALICNRLPLLQDGTVVGAAAFTTLDNMATVYHLHDMLLNMQKENLKYKEELKQLRKSRDPLERIIGQTPAILDLKKVIHDFARSNLSILITGETGVGKEVFASALHELSTRKMNSFVKINCAAIPKDLLESELFGYEEGSFTGAKKHGKPGKFELADNGTILLDEIGEMSMPLQSKLLRVLQEHEIERVGSITPRKINVRVICSTNQDIPAMIKQGTFREDLYYRINTIEMKIPPLRERLEDIPALCTHFIHKINAESGGRTRGISAEVLDLFCTYRWPGNVRELEHTLERLCFQSQNEEITLRDCDFFRKKIARQNGPEKISSPAAPAKTADANAKSSLQYNRALAETEAIVRALEQSGGNKAKAARLLGIDRSSLYYKLKKYHL